MARQNEWDNNQLLAWQQQLEEEAILLESSVSEGSLSDGKKYKETVKTFFDESENKSLIGTVYSSDSAKRKELSSKINSIILNTGRTIVDEVDPITGRAKTTKRIDLLEQISDFNRERVSVTTFSQPEKDVINPRNVHIKGFTDNRRLAILTGNLTSSAENYSDIRTQRQYNIALITEDSEAIKSFKNIYGELSKNQTPSSRGPIVVGGSASNELVRKISSAKKGDSLRIVSPFIDDQFIVAAIAKAKKEGVDVTVITSPGKEDESGKAGFNLKTEIAINKLVASGVKVLVPGKDDNMLLHLKAVSIKSKGEVNGYVGSHNLSDSARRNNTIDIMTRVSGNVGTALDDVLSNLPNELGLKEYKASQKVTPVSATEMRMAQLGTLSLYKINARELDANGKKVALKEQLALNVEVPLDKSVVPTYSLRLPTEYLQSFRNQGFIPTFNVFESLYKARGAKSETPDSILELDAAISSLPLGEAINFKTGLSLYKKDSGFIGSGVKSVGAGLDYLFGYYDYQEHQKGKADTNFHTIRGFVGMLNKPESEEVAGPFQTILGTASDLVGGLSVAIGSYLGISLPITHLKAKFTDASINTLLQPKATGRFSSVINKVSDIARVATFGHGYGSLINVAIANAVNEQQIVENVFNYMAAAKHGGPLPRELHGKLNILGDSGDALELGQQTSLFSFMRASRTFDSARFNSLLRPIFNAVSPYSYSEAAKSPYQVFQASLDELESTLSAPTKLVVAEQGIALNKLQVTNVGEQRVAQIAKAFDRVGSLLPANLAYWLPSVREGLGFEEFDPTKNLVWRDLFSLEESIQWVSQGFTSASNLLGLGKMPAAPWYKMPFVFTSNLIKTTIQNFKEVRGLWDLSKAYKESLNDLNTKFPLINNLDEYGTIRTNSSLSSTQQANDLLDQQLERYRRLKADLELHTQSDEFIKVQNIREELFGSYNKLRSTLGIDYKDPVKHPLSASAGNANERTSAPELIKSGNSDIARQARAVKSTLFYIGTAFLTDALLDWTVLNNGVSLFKQLFAARDLTDESGQSIAKFKFEGNLPVAFVAPISISTGLAAGYLFSAIKASHTSEVLTDINDKGYKSLIKDIPADVPVLIDPAKKFELKTLQTTVSSGIDKAVSLKRLTPSINKKVALATGLLTAVALKKTSELIANSLNKDGPELDPTKGTTSAILEKESLEAMQNANTVGDRTYSSLMFLMAQDNLVTKKIDSRIYNVATQATTPFFQIAALARTDTQKNTVSFGVGLQLAPTLGLGMNNLLPFSIQLAPNAFNTAESYIQNQQFLAGELNALEVAGIAVNTGVSALAGGSNLIYEKNSDYFNIVNYIGTTAIVTSGGGVAKRFLDDRKVFSGLSNELDTVSSIFNTPIIKAGVKTTNKAFKNLATLPFQFVATSYGALEKTINIKGTKLAGLGILAYVGLQSGASDVAKLFTTDEKQQTLMTTIPKWGLLASAVVIGSKPAAERNRLMRKFAPYYLAFTFARAITNPGSDYNGEQIKTADEQLQATLGITLAMGYGLSSSGAFASGKELAEKHLINLNRELGKGILSDGNIPRNIHATETIQEWFNAKDLSAKPELIEWRNKYIEGINAVEAEYLKSKGGRPGLWAASLEASKDAAAPYIFKQVPSISYSDVQTKASLDYRALRSRVGMAAKAYAAVTIGASAIAYLLPNGFRDALYRIPVLGSALRVLSGAPDSKVLSESTFDPQQFLGLVIKNLTLNATSFGLYKDKPDPFLADVVGPFGTTFKPTTAKYLQYATMSSDLSLSSFVTALGQTSMSYSEDALRQLVKHRGEGYSARDTYMAVRGAANRATPMTVKIEIPKSGGISLGTRRRAFLTEHMRWQRPYELGLDLRSEAIATGLLGTDINPEYTNPAVWSPFLSIGAGQFFLSKPGEEAKKEIANIYGLEDQISSLGSVDWQKTFDNLIGGFGQATFGNPLSTIPFVLATTAFTYFAGVQLAAAAVNLTKPTSTVDLSMDMAKPIIGSKEYRFVPVDIRGDGSRKIFQVPAGTWEGMAMPVDPNKFGRSMKAIDLAKNLYNQHLQISKVINEFLPNSLFNDLEQYTVHGQSADTVAARSLETLKEKLKVVLSKEIVAGSGITVYQSMFTSKFTNPDEFVDDLLKDKTNKLAKIIEAHDNPHSDALRRRLEITNAVRRSSSYSEIVQRLKEPSGGTFSALPNTKVRLVEAARAPGDTWTERISRNTVRTVKGSTKYVGSWVAEGTSIYEGIEGLGILFNQDKDRNLRIEGGVGLFSAITQLGIATGITAGLAAAGIAAVPSLILGAGLAVGLGVLKSMFPRAIDAETKLYRGLADWAVRPGEKVGSILGPIGEAVTNAALYLPGMLLHQVLKPINFITDKITGPLLSKIWAGSKDSHWTRALLQQLLLPSSSYINSELRRQNSLAVATNAIRRASALDNMPSPTMLHPNYLGGSAGARDEMMYDKYFRSFSGTRVLSQFGLGSNRISNLMILSLQRRQGLMDLTVTGSMTQRLGKDTLSWKDIAIATGMLAAGAFIFNKGKSISRSIVNSIDKKLTMINPFVARRTFGNEIAARRGALKYLQQINPEANFETVADTFEFKTKPTETYYEPSQQKVYLSAEDIKGLAAEERGLGSLLDSTKQSILHEIAHGQEFKETLKRLPTVQRKLVSNRALESTIKYHNYARSQGLVVSKQELKEVFKLESEAHAVAERALPSQTAKSSVSLNSQYKDIYREAVDLGKGNRITPNADILYHSSAAELEVSAPTEAVEVNKVRSSGDIRGQVGRARADFLDAFDETKATGNKLNSFKAKAMAGFNRIGFNPMAALNWIGNALAISSGYYNLEDSIALRTKASRFKQLTPAMQGRLYQTRNTELDTIKLTLGTAVTGLFTSNMFVALGVGLGVSVLGKFLPDPFNISKRETEKDIEMARQGHYNSSFIASSGQYARLSRDSVAAKAFIRNYSDPLITDAKGIISRKAKPLLDRLPVSSFTEGPLLERLATASKITVVASVALGFGEDFVLRQKWDKLSLSQKSQYGSFEQYIRRSKSSTLETVKWTAITGFGLLALKSLVTDGDVDLAKEGSKLYRGALRTFVTAKKQVIKLINKINFRNISQTAKAWIEKLRNVKGVDSITSVLKEFKNYVVEQVKKSPLGTNERFKTIVESLSSSYKKTGDKISGEYKSFARSSKKLKIKVLKGIRNISNMPVWDNLKEGLRFVKGKVKDGLDTLSKGINYVTSGARNIFNSVKENLSDLTDRVIVKLTKSTTLKTFFSQAGDVINNVLSFVSGKKFQGKKLTWSDIVENPFVKKVTSKVAPRIEAFKAAAERTILKKGLLSATLDVLGPVLDVTTWLSGVRQVTKLHGGSSLGEYEAGYITAEKATQSFAGAIAGSVFGVWGTAIGSLVLPMLLGDKDARDRAKRQYDKKEKIGIAGIVMDFVLPAALQLFIAKSFAKFGDMAMKKGIIPNLHSIMQEGITKAKTATFSDQKIRVRDNILKKAYRYQLSQLQLLDPDFDGKGAPKLILGKEDAYNPATKTISLKRSTAIALGKKTVDSRARAILLHEQAHHLQQTGKLKHIAFTSELEISKKVRNDIKRLSLQSTVQYAKANPSASRAELLLVYKEELSANLRSYAIAQELVADAPDVLDTKVFKGRSFGSVPSELHTLYAAAPPVKRNRLFVPLYSKLYINKEIRNLKSGIIALTRISFKDLPTLNKPIFAGDLSSLDDLIGKYKVFTMRLETVETITAKQSLEKTRAGKFDGFYRNIQMSRRAYKFEMRYGIQEARFYKESRTYNKIDLMEFVEAKSTIRNSYNNQNINLERSYKTYLDTANILADRHLTYKEYTEYIEKFNEKHYIAYHPTKSDYISYVAAKQRQDQYFVFSKIIDSLPEDLKSKFSNRNDLKNVRFSDQEEKILNEYKQLEGDLNKVTPDNVVDLNSWTKEQVNIIKKQMFNNLIGSVENSLKEIKELIPELISHGLSHVTYPIRNRLYQLSTALKRANISPTKLLNRTLGTIDLAAMFLDVKQATVSRSELDKTVRNIQTKGITDKSKEELTKARAWEVGNMISSVGGNSINLFTGNFIAALAFGGLSQLYQAYDPTYMGLSTYLAQRDKEALERGETVTTFGPTLGFYVKSNKEIEYSRRFIQAATKKAMPTIKTALRYGLSVFLADKAISTLANDPTNTDNQVQAGLYAWGSLAAAAPSQTIKTTAKLHRVIGSAFVVGGALKIKDGTIKEKVEGVGSVILGSALMAPKQAVVLAIKTGFFITENVVPKIAELYAKALKLKAKVTTFAVKHRVSIVTVGSIATIMGAVSEYTKAKQREELLLLQNSSTSNRAVLKELGITSSTPLKEVETKLSGKREQLSTELAAATTKEEKEQITKELAEIETLQKVVTAKRIESENRERTLNAIGITTSAGYNLYARRKAIKKWIDKSPRVKLAINTVVGAFKYIAMSPVNVFKDVSKWVINRGKNITLRNWVKQIPGTVFGALKYIAMSPIHVMRDVTKWINNRRKGLVLRNWVKQIPAATLNALKFTAMSFVNVGKGIAIWGINHLKNITVRDWAKTFTKRLGKQLIQLPIDIVKQSAKLVGGTAKLTWGAAKSIAKGVSWVAKNIEVRDWVKKSAKRLGGLLIQLPIDVVKQSAKLVWGTTKLAWGAAKSVAKGVSWITEKVEVRDWVKRSAKRLGGLLIRLPIDLITQSAKLVWGATKLTWNVGKGVVKGVSWISKKVEVRDWVKTFTKRLAEQAILLPIDIVKQSAKLVWGTTKLAWNVGKAVTKGTTKLVWNVGKAVTKGASWISKNVEVRDWVKRLGKQVISFPMDFLYSVGFTIDKVIQNKYVRNVAGLAWKATKIAATLPIDLAKTAYGLAKGSYYIGRRISRSLGKVLRPVKKLGKMAAELSVGIARTAYGLAKGSYYLGRRISRSIGGLLRSVRKSIKKVSRSVGRVTDRVVRSSNKLLNKLNINFIDKIVHKGFKEAALDSVGFILDAAVFADSYKQVASLNSKSDKAEIKTAYAYLGKSVSSFMGSIFGSRFGGLGELIGSIAAPLIFKPSEAWLEERARLKETGDVAALQYGVKPLVRNIVIAAGLGDLAKSKVLPYVDKQLGKYTANIFRRAKYGIKYKWYDSLYAAKKIEKVRNFSKAAHGEIISDLFKQTSQRARKLVRLTGSAEVKAIDYQARAIKAFGKTMTAAELVAKQEAFLTKLGTAVRPVAKVSKVALRFIDPAISAITIGAGINDLTSSDKKDYVAKERGARRVFSGLGSLAGSIIGGVVGTFVGGPAGTIIGSAGGSMAGEKLGDFLGSDIGQEAVKKNVSGGKVLLGTGLGIAAGVIGTGLLIAGGVIASVPIALAAVAGLALFGAYVGAKAAIGFFGKSQNKYTYNKEKWDYLTDLEKNKKASEEEVPWYKKVTNFFVTGFMRATNFLVTSTKRVIKAVGDFFIPPARAQTTSGHDHDHDHDHDHSGHGRKEERSVNYAEDRLNVLNSKALDAAGISQTSGSLATLKKKGWSDSDIDYVIRLINAESGGESFGGQVAVARVTLNRIAGVQTGSISRGDVGATNSTVKGIVNASQYEPVQSGAINKKISKESYARAKKALETALDTKKSIDAVRSAGVSQGEAEDIVYRSLYFRAHYAKGSEQTENIVLGGHKFGTYNSAAGRRIWDASIGKQAVDRYLGSGVVETASKKPQVLNIQGVRDVLSEYNELANDDPYSGTVAKNGVRLSAESYWKKGSSYGIREALNADPRIRASGMVVGSAFGNRAVSGSHQHPAIDVNSINGKQLKQTSPFIKGEVVRVGGSHGTIDIAEIDPETGKRTGRVAHFLHSNVIHVKRGQVIKGGTVVGAEGSAGGYAVHSHFGIYLEGKTPSLDGSKTIKDRGRNWVVPTVEEILAAHGKGAAIKPVERQGDTYRTKTTPSDMAVDKNKKIATPQTTAERIKTQRYIDDSMRAVFVQRLKEGGATPEQIKLAEKQIADYNATLPKEEIETAKKRGQIFDAKREATRSEEIKNRGDVVQDVIDEVTLSNRASAAVIPNSKRSGRSAAEDNVRRVLPSGLTAAQEESLVNLRKLGMTAAQVESVRQESLADNRKNGRVYSSPISAKELQPFLNSRNKIKYTREQETRVLSNGLTEPQHRMLAEMYASKMPKEKVHTYRRWLMEQNLSGGNTIPSNSSARNTATNTRASNSSARNAATTKASIRGLQSAYVVEVGTGKVVQAFNSRSIPASPASTIKLIVADLVIDAIKTGKLKGDQRLTVTKEVVAQGEGKHTQGKKVSIDVLLDSMLRESNNTAANILIKSLGGVKKADELAKKKYSGTTIANYLSVPGATGFKNKSTAQDTTNAMLSILRDPSREANIAEAALRGTRNFKYKNETGGKIGNNSKVIGNVGLVTVNGKEYIVTAYANTDGNRLENRQIITNFTNDVVKQLATAPKTVSSQVPSSPPKTVSRADGKRSYTQTEMNVIKSSGLTKAQEDVVIDWIRAGVPSEKIDAMRRATLADNKKQGRIYTPPAVSETQNKVNKKDTKNKPTSKVVKKVTPTATGINVDKSKPKDYRKNDTSSVPSSATATVASVKRIVTNDKVVNQIEISNPGQSIATALPKVSHLPVSQDSTYQKMDTALS